MCDRVQVMLEKIFHMNFIFCILIILYYIILCYIILYYIILYYIILYYIILYYIILLCVLFYHVCIAVLHTLVAGLLARSQYPEGPATRPPRHRFFSVSLCLKANAEMVPKTPSCYCKLLM